MAQTGRSIATAIAVATSAGCAGAPVVPDGDGPNATVVEVVDGDTIDVDIGGRRERVRLLGIDTPEVAHPAGPDRPATDGECFGDEASDFSAGLLPAGTPVRLERDIVGRDHFGRILAHVFSDTGHVNVELVRRGFATPLTIEPNVVHRAAIVAAAVAAESEELGLWGACG